jgi:integrase
MSAGLGAYPTVTLQIARVEAQQAKLLAKDGHNISSAKKVAKATQTTKGSNTFGLIAAEWLEHNKADWSRTHHERNEGLIRRHLLPDLAKLPIESINEKYLFTVIKKVYDKGTKVSALRTRTIAAQIFSYARATHRAIGNPARDMSDNPYFKKPTVKHFEAIAQNEVPKLMAALNKTGKAQQLDIKTVFALKLSMYTGLRDNSVRGARWREIDFERCIWTIPAERMKSRKEFKVPLSDAYCADELHPTALANS